MRRKAATDASIEATSRSVSDRSRRSVGVASIAADNSSTDVAGSCAITEGSNVIGSKLPKRGGKPRHRTWTGPQAGKFLNATAGTRWFSLWQLALATCVAASYADCAGTTSTWTLVWCRLSGQRPSSASSASLRHRRTMSAARSRSISRRLRAACLAQGAGRGAACLVAGVVDQEGLIFAWEDGSPVLSGLHLQGVQEGSGGVRLRASTVGAPRGAQLPRNDAFARWSARPHRGEGSATGTRASL